MNNVFKIRSKKKKNKQDGEQWDFSSASGGTALTCMVIRVGEERHLVQQVNELELHVRGHTHWSSVSSVRSHLFTLITWTDLSVDGCVSEETCLSHFPIMKKQVKFAESQMIHRLHQDEALPRGNRKSKHDFRRAFTISSLNKQNMSSILSALKLLKDANMNSNNGLKTSRPAAVRSEPELQHMTTVTIPKTMTGAPFLKHSALTPAQKEFLYTIAASSSTTHVRNLITQHYMNVLHRCVPTGRNPEGDDTLGTSLLETNEGEKHRSEVSSRVKNMKINTSAKNPGKSFLPKIPNRQTRISNKSATKQRLVKTPTATSPAVRRKSPRRVRIGLLEEEEEGLTDSLSDCLSSLSVGEWGDDVLSDL